MLIVFISAEWKIGVAYNYNFRRVEILYSIQ